MKVYSLRETFSIDLRALGVFRIALAALTILDSLNRLTIARAHYSDEGVLPRAAFLSELATPTDLSLHLISGHLAFQVFLIGLQVLCAALVLVGARPRLFAFVTWILLLSLHNRLPLNLWRRRRFASSVVLGDLSSIGCQIFALLAAAPKA